MKFNEYFFHIRDHATKDDKVIEEFNGKGTDAGGGERFSSEAAGGEEFDSKPGMQQNISKISFKISKLKMIPRTTIDGKFI